MEITTVQQNKEQFEAYTEQIKKQLRAYNISHEPMLKNYADSDFCITHHDENGQFLGGIHAGFMMGNLQIYFVTLDEACRGKGIGMKLMQAIEDHAKTVKPAFTAYTETFDFQALPFYQKCGFDVQFYREYDNNRKMYFLKKEVV